MVVKTHNRFYHVKLGRRTVLCSPKGIFKQATSPEYRLPVVGDQVSVSVANVVRKGVDGYITKIHTRRNFLSRADGDGRTKIMAANLNRTLVVCAVKKPGVDFPLLDRYLLTCELAGLECGLLINKLDLAPDFLEQPCWKPYLRMGIPILGTSAKSGLGLQELVSLVSSGVFLLTGPSGVGKSTLINCLVPEANLTTGTVDPKKGRGRHTTTHSILVPVGKNGFLVDSPGLRDFYPPLVSPEQTRFGFREIAAVQSGCKFSTCLHDGEPGCAVTAAVDQGEISENRYKSYRFILREMQQHDINKYR